jgi:DNA polymerase I-like protein with 3'-5' exonuclease and polymerase domains
MRNLWKKLQKNVPKIAYNPYGTITGRLGVQSGSFPILNVSREARRAILPNNDCFVELDFNAAELRVLLALNGKDQPENDIHEWNAKNVFKESLDRDEIKKKTFSWLYNPKAVDKTLETCYNKERVKEKYFDGSHVNTTFGRKIEADDHHALNYIVQSTTSDLFLKQAIKIWKILKGRRSNVAFTIHDSLIMDYHLSDKELIKDLIEEFSNTELGKFKVNVSGGKNFGNMKKMDL